MSEEDILNHVSEYIVFSHPTLRKLEFGAGGTGTVSLIVHWGKPQKGVRYGEHR